MSSEDTGSMSIREIVSLTDWLLSRGHTPTEVLDCIKFIAMDNHDE